MAAREYSTWRAFLADLELIFANARHFNKAAHPVHKAAVEVHAKCLRFLEERDGAALEKAAREVAPVPLHPCLSCFEREHCSVLEPLWLLCA